MPLGPVLPRALLSAFGCGCSGSAAVIGPGAAALANAALAWRCAYNPLCLLTCCAATPSILQAQAAEELANAALALSHYQAATDADEVDLDLIESLLSYICEVGGLLSGRLWLPPCFCVSRWRVWPCRAGGPAADQIRCRACCDATGRKVAALL